MKAFLVTASCLASTITAHAQFRASLGPLVGANLATLHNADRIEYGYRFGALAGAQAELSWGRFSVQPALAFSQLGATRTYTLRTLDPNDPALPNSTVTYTERFNYLVLPVPVAFSPNGTKTGPQVFAGPYVGVLLGGLPTDSRLDAGLQAGLGLRVKEVLLRASYNLGMRSTETMYTSSQFVANYNRSFQVAASYLFTLR